MKKSKKLLMATLLTLPLLSGLLDSLFANPSVPPLSNQGQIIPSTPTLAAKAYLLIDHNSGRVLAEHNAQMRVEPASLTKMMTVYVIDHALKKGKFKLTDLVHVSTKAWKMQGSRMFLNVNSDVSIDELIKGIIIQSGNDASVALAEHLSGNEEAFVDLMNAYAQELKMTHTHFMNATGMPDDNHYTTAQDLARLSQALIKEFPESYNLYAEKWFTHQNIKQPNRNQLLWRNESVDGIKTGHTDSAGFCLVASGLKDNMRLIAVVMGTQSDYHRTEETNKLLTYGFRFYETHKLYSANTLIHSARIWMGKEKNIKIGVDKDVYITVGHGQYPKLQTINHLHSGLRAPLSQGTSVGELQASIDGTSVLNHPLVALETVLEGSIFSRVYDYIVLNIQVLREKLFGTRS